MREASAERRSVTIFGHTLFRERANVISPRPCWVCFYDCYMHVDESLPRLVWSLITEHGDDKHLVG